MKFIKSMIFFILFCACAHAASEVIAEFSEKTLPILTEQLRQIEDRLNSIEARLTAHSI